MTDVLSDRALNRATLARQLLLERSSMPALDAIEQLVGMQAQHPFAPYFGLWSRLEDFQPEELAKLLIERRAVRAALLRGTVHLVSAADCRPLRRLTQPTFDRDLRVNATHAKALHGLDHSALRKAVTDDLAESPLGIRELSLELHRRWPKRPAASLVHAARGLLCLVQTPPRAVWGKSGATRLFTADGWLGPENKSNRPLTLQTLALRYFAAFGPATVQDFQAWSGLTRLTDAVERLGTKLLRFRSDTGADLFDVSDAPRPHPDTPAPVRLVAPFDNLLLAFVDRERFMDQTTRKRFLGIPNGNLPGALLNDGLVAGTWSVTTGRGQRRLTVTPYRRLRKAEEEEVEVEADRLRGKIVS